jgi:hypothetical protein
MESDHNKRDSIAYRGMLRLHMHNVNECIKRIPKWGIE